MNQAENILLESSKNGDVDRLNALLQRYYDDPNVNLNIKDPLNGNTSLIWAAKRGHGAIVQALLKYNCDVTLLNNENQSAIEVAPNAIRKVLLENGSKTYPFSYQLLHQACWQGNSKAVCRLLSVANKPLNLSSSNLDGYTPLHLATRDLLLFEKLSQQVKLYVYDPQGVVLELLTHGYDVSILGELRERRTPLHLAASSPAKVSEAVIKLLLNFGASVSICDVYKFTPLHCAAYSGNSSAMQYLIEKNANVNAAALKGSTPLHLGSMAGHETVVDLLLKFGADPSLKDNDSETPIDIAKTRRIKFILEGKYSKENTNRPVVARTISNQPSTQKKKMIRNRSCTSLLEIQNNLENQKSSPRENVVSNGIKPLTVTSIPIAKHGKVELCFIKNFRETSNLELSTSVNLTPKSRPNSTQQRWKSSPNVSIYSPNTSINKGFHLPSISSSTPRITSSSSVSTERSQSGNFKVIKRIPSFPNQDDVFITENSLNVESNGLAGRNSSKTYLEDLEDMDTGMVQINVSDQQTHILNDDLNTIHEANEELSYRGFDGNKIPSGKPTNVDCGFKTNTNAENANATSHGPEKNNTDEPSIATNLNNNTLGNSSRNTWQSQLLSKNKAINKSKAIVKESPSIQLNKNKSSSIASKNTSSPEKNKITVIKDLDQVANKPLDGDTLEDPIENMKKCEHVLSRQESKNSIIKISTNKTTNSAVQAKKKSKNVPNNVEQKKVNLNSSGKNLKTKSQKSAVSTPAVAKPKTLISKPKVKSSEKVEKTSVAPESKAEKSPVNELLPVVSTAQRLSVPNSTTSTSDGSSKSQRLSIPNSTTASKGNSSTTSPLMHSPPPIGANCVQPTASISAIGWHVSTDGRPVEDLKQEANILTFKVVESAKEDEEILSEIESEVYEDDFESDIPEEDDRKVHRRSPTLADIASRTSFLESDLTLDFLNNNKTLKACDQTEDQIVNDQTKENENDSDRTYILKEENNSDKPDINADKSSSAFTNRDNDYNSLRSNMSVDSSHGFSETIVPLWCKGKLLGTGAFGKVWSCLTELGEQLAVKEIHYDSTDQVKTEVRHIQEEIDILKNLKHRNIVHFYGTTKENGCVLIFMEFVPGGSLATALTQYGAFSEKVFRRYTRQIVDGVYFLHMNNVMHRDIKGANVMLMPNGTIKLIDFGCAKRLQMHMSISSTGTKQKSLIGSPYWMAPEVITEIGHGRKSDVWSIGCTVFEMATGKPPWGDMPKMAAMFAIGSGDNEQPKLSKDKFSEYACSFVSRCMTRDVDTRPSAAELLQHPFISESRPSRCSQSREPTMMTNRSTSLCENN